MLKIALPPAAAPADIPGEIRLQIMSSCAEPPARGGWLRSSTTDTASWRSVAGERVKLVSHNGYDRTAFGGRLCAISP